MSRPALFIVAAVVAWGVAPMFDKLAVREGVDPMVGLFIRATTAFVVSMLILLVGGRLPLAIEVPTTTILMFMAGGVLSAVVGMWCYFSALKDYDTHLVVALTCTYPALTMVLSFLLLGEKVSPRQWFAMVMIVGGIMLLEYSSPSPEPVAPAERS